MNNKNKILSLRMTEPEYESIQAKAKLTGCTPSDYIRTRAVREEVFISPSAIAALAKVLNAVIPELPEDERARVIATWNNAIS